MIPEGCVAACPGCRHREFSAAESEAQKLSWAKKNLSEFSAPVLPIAVPDERLGYRRKACLHARYLDGQWQFGLVLKRWKEETFVPIPQCPVQSEGLNAIFAGCSSLPAMLPIAFVLVSGRALTLVLKTKRSEKILENIGNSVPQLLAAGAESIFVNWNPAAGRRVLSSRHMELIHGPQFLKEGAFLHGPTAFRQQIPELEDLAQRLAVDHLASCESIVDLYCGLGISLARWREKGKDALGVELVGEACDLAALNAPGSKILKGKIEERLPQLRALAPGFGVYTNPPRTGHGALICQWLEEAKPERIAYLSCNMRSLRDDLRNLPSYGATLIQPLDFFPLTDHVEAIVLLQLTLSPRKITRSLVPAGFS